MIHLKSIIENDIDYEAGKSKHITQEELSAPRKNIRLACEIDGFWFCLTYTQWSKYRDIQYATLLARRQVRNTGAQILEFEGWRNKPVKKHTGIKCINYRMKL